LNGRAKVLGILQNLTRPPVDTDEMDDSDEEIEEEQEVPNLLLEMMMCALV
jgi:hypothetical protein